MGKREWEVEDHLVELEHGWLSGSAIIAVDDIVVFTRSNTFFDCGFAHRFDVDGIPCAVKVFGSGFGFRYEFVSGEEAETVKESNRMPVNWTQQLSYGLPVGVLIGFLIICVTEFLLQLFPLRK